MTPKKLTSQELAETLRSMAKSIEENDSFEGSIEYSFTSDPGIFEAMGSFRIGNSEGQGGCVLIGDIVHQ